MEVQRPKFLAAYDTSGRSKCKRCKEKIPKGALRVGKAVPWKNSPFGAPGDDVMIWFHAKCLLRNPGIFRDMKEVGGVGQLRAEDRQALRAYLREGPAALVGAFPEGSGPDPRPSAPGAPKTRQRQQAPPDLGVAPARESDDPEDFGVQYAEGGKSTCHECGARIEKGVVRMAKIETDEEGVPVARWRHVPCMIQSGLWLRPWADMPGWQMLREQDQEALLEGRALVEPREEGERGGQGKGAKGRGKGIKGNGKGEAITVRRGASRKKGLDKGSSAASTKEGPGKKRKARDEDGDWEEGHEMSQCGRRG